MKNRAPAGKGRDEENERTRNSLEKIFAAIILLSIANAAPGTGWADQPSQAVPQEWSFNVPSSPLEIRFSPGKRDMQFFNRSSGRVSQFRLGCVRQVGESTKILHRFSAVKSDLLAGKALINSLTVYDANIQHCSAVRTKFAVIEVSFRDGSMWRVR